MIQNLFTIKTLKKKIRLKNPVWDFPKAFPKKRTQFLARRESETLIYLST